MVGYTLKRLAWAAAVILTVAALVFVLAFILPADPARVVAGPHASANTVASIRHALGLDQPFFIQLGAYLGRLAHGDLGYSYVRDSAVLTMVLQRLPATIELAAGGIVVELAIGIPLGLLAAARRGTVLDRIPTLLSVILVSAPSFLLGYLLLYLFAFMPAVNLGVTLFPIGGYKALDLRYLFLPALTLGSSGMAYYLRLTRTAALDELSRDYARTARAKGASTRQVLLRHVAPNILPPLITQLGLDVGTFLGGVVLVETVFAWPGIGQLTVQSILAADVPVIMGVVMFGALAVVLANLAVDIVYGILDPRVRILA
jgi:peptide/nickel transport system permease protein